MKIRPIRSQLEIDEAREVAMRDGSYIHWPTHVIKRANGQIMGTLSVIPCVLLWSHHDMLERESIEVRDFVEGLISNQSRVVAMPCPKDSAYLKHMMKPDSGFSNLGDVQLFLKGL